MKGEDCGFLHVFDPARLPVCRNLIKFGECKEPDCPFKHSLEDVKVRAPAIREASSPVGGSMWGVHSSCMKPSCQATQLLKGVFLH